MKRFKNILAVYSGNVGDDEALNHAASLAQSNEGRLRNLAVADVDECSQELYNAVTDRLGASPVQIDTKRGRHFYFSNPDNVRFHFDGLPIDFKTGFNSYVAGPYSRRQDGGFYEPVKGCLGVDTLPIIPRLNSEPLRGTRRATEGRRNRYLTKVAKDRVLSVDSVDELAANLRFERDEWCETGSHSISDTEIIRIVNWAWKLREEGRVWGGEQMLQFKTRSVNELVTNPEGGVEAFALLSILKSRHPMKGTVFGLNFDGMKEAGYITFGKPTFRKAIKLLLALGHLKKVAGYSVGRRGNQYRIERR